MAKRRGVGDRLKSTVVRAFRRQRDFAEAYEKYMPEIEKASIEIAQAAVGTEMTTKLLEEVVVAMKTLSDKMNESATALGAATFGMKEYENDPAAITEIFSDTATVAANLEIAIATDPDLLTRALFYATADTRAAAIAEMDEVTRGAWLDDLLDDMLDAEVEVDDETE